ncbi:MAG TPA: hypothetical protein VGE07_05970, partial [Herpetosiphonaceae bacterium]
TGAPGSDNYALKAFSATDAWVGGLACLNESCGGRKITLARRVGQEWVNMLPETWDGRVLAIDGVASTDVWALGDYGDLQQGYLRAWHWDGVQLTAHAIPAAMNGVAMVTATDGWAVGPKGAIIHWDGTAWRPYVPLLRQTYLPLTHR